MGKATDSKRPKRSESYPTATAREVALDADDAALQAFAAWCIARGIRFSKKVRCWK